jgi:hypothetical protein
MNKYPSEHPSTIPGSGGMLYKYILDNLSIPARLPHEIWYNSQKAKLDDPHDPFKGFYPVGKKLRFMVNNEWPLVDYIFTGKETFPVFVKSLSPEAQFELGISKDADPSAKVFNPNFVAYDDLSESTKMSNEILPLSLAKSFSSYLCLKVNASYSEQHVVDMLVTALKRADSPEMAHILHGNYNCWCAMSFLKSRKVEEDVKREFYGQNNEDFYMKDIGTIMPSILYTLTIVGANPLYMYNMLTYDLYGIKDIAKVLEGYMKVNQKGQKVA